MKKITFAIQQWWHKVGNEYYQKKVLRREREVKEEAMRRLQVREHEGKLYLCFDNIPILQDIDIEGRLENAVQLAREYYADYMATRRYSSLG